VTDWQDLRRTGDHPQPGRIAAHAERRLGGEEATRLTEHIAACATCYEIFAETARFVLDEEAEEVSPKRSPLGIAIVRHPLFRLAAVLAVAASVLVAFQSIRRAPSGRPGPPFVAELAQAMGTRRFVEPRLTGGFQHGRHVVLRSGEAPQGLDAHSPEVLAAVARIRARAQHDPSAEAQGALAITYLVSGDLGAALRALETATAEDATNPRLQSDLAAAYLVRAARLDEPADLPKALEAAEKAIALPDPPREAYFNRALALEGLHLTDAARAAWEDYLKRDGSAGWAEEARQHLERLRPERQSSVEEDQALVRAALQEGPAAVDRLAGESPSLLRDYFQDHVLPAWADAHLEGRADERALTDEARLLGDALLLRTGDALPSETALALAAPPAAAAAADPLRRQALGFRALRDGERLYDRRAESSCPLHRGAVRELEAGASPRATWARLQVVTTCLFLTDRKAATAELGRIEAVATTRRFTHLRGRVHWMQGLILAEGGDLTASLTRYGLARDAFAQVRDPEGEARILTLIAENLRLLGENRRAWRDRVRSLALLGGVRSAHNRHGVLDEAVTACTTEQTPRSGLHFEDALVASALRWAAADAASEALLRRAALHRALGDFPAAAADLVASGRFMAQVSDPPVGQRLAAEAQATRGELLGLTQPEAAVRSLREAAVHYRVTAPERIPSLQLLLGRALLHQGLLDAAEHELMTGIRELERQRTSLRDVALQISFFDLGLPLFDDMVRLQVERGEPERGLAFVERGRSRQLLDALQSRTVADDAHPLPAALSSSPLEPQALRSQLQDGVALLYYVALEDRLYMWSLSRSGCQFVQRRLSAAHLRQLVARHRAALEQPSSVTAARVTGAAVYDELVRPLLPALAAQQRLIFVPDGALQAVPFASLVNRETGRYLVEDHLLGLAPSGTVFVRTSALARSLQGQRHALIVGNPRFDHEAFVGLVDLPGAEAEAIEIARLYESAVLLTGSQATKRAFLEGMGTSEVVHFAGHAASGTPPGSSARLLLASDGVSGRSGALDLHELASGRLARTRLVVLAACRTAAGAVSSSEGALSLGRPFLAAGVANVVASLWDIDDVVSRRFFVAFHRALLTIGEPLLALRQAQIALLHDEDPSLAHPASWAAFVCMGGLSPQGVVAPTEASASPPL